MYNWVLMRRLIGIAFTLIYVTACAFAEEPIGVVKVVQGSVSVIRGQTMPCQENMHILSKDVFRTGADGRVGLLFSDGTRVSLDPNSELNIEKFRFAPAQKEFEFVMKLVRGVAAYVSGKIAQLSPGSVQVETPVAVIGLRGTHVVISLEQ
jgi:hypothetical protein